MRPTQRPDDWEDPVEFVEVRRPDRLLVAFDGSHAAERALGWAALVGQSGVTEVVVLVAFEPPLTIRGRGATYVSEVRDDLAQEANELAREAVELLLQRGISARAIVVQGDPAQSILEAAVDEDVDLVAIGRQGLTAEVGGISAALERFRSTIGGVADKVVRHAHVPVLVVD